MYVAKSFTSRRIYIIEPRLSTRVRVSLIFIKFTKKGNFVKIHSVALHSKNSNFKKVRMKLSFGLLHETYCTCAGLDIVYHLYSHVFSNVHVNPL